jgi:hypothetical protein
MFSVKTAAPIILPASFRRSCGVCPVPNTCGRCSILPPSKPIEGRGLIVRPRLAKGPAAADPSLCTCIPNQIVRYSVESLKQSPQHGVATKHEVAGICPARRRSRTYREVKMDCTSIPHPKLTWSKRSLSYFRCMRSFASFCPCFDNLSR